MLNVEYFNNSSENDSRIAMTIPCRGISIIDQPNSVALKTETNLFIGRRALSAGVWRPDDRHLDSVSGRALEANQAPLLAPEYSIQQCRAEL